MPVTGDSDILIKCVGLRKVFKTRGDEVHALKGIDLDIIRGEYLSIMGPSGSGKSTLFNMIGGLDRPTAGQVLIEGVDLPSLPSKRRAYVRNAWIGYVFQTFNLIPVLTALQNVSLPIIFSGMAKPEAEEKARKLLADVGLGERTHHRPDELSGGQQQRVAIARSLANDPRIILADEPTGNLDLKTGEDIIGILKDLSENKGVTIVTATHDHKMLAASDRVVWISDGAVEKIVDREHLEIQSGSIGGEP
jgi:putative ABC transport system ATP-binding protein